MQGFPKNKELVGVAERVLAARRARIDLESVNQAMGDVNLNLVEEKTHTTGSQMLSAAYAKEA